MEFFKASSIDFMGLRYKAAIFSLLLCVLSVGSLCVRGLHLGLDFTGGTELKVAYTEAPSLTHVRSQLEAAGFHDAVVQVYGEARRLLIRVGQYPQYSQQVLVDRVMAALPKATKLAAEFVGPQVGKELATSGILAVLVSFVLTGLYIAFRFEYRLAISSTVALIHDPIVILGVFSWWQLEFNLIALTAILTVIGYSLNDTIVIFDRVRENFSKMHQATPPQIINVSVNQTLSRTIMTSGLTFLVVLVLFALGGPVVHGFSLALMVGIVVGTYSSIYVAGSLAVSMGLTRSDFLRRVRTKALDDRP